MRLRPLFLGLAAATIAGSSQAHDTWLMPDAMTGTIGGGASACLTSGLAFPEAERGPAVDRVDWTGAITGETFELAELSPAATRPCNKGLRIDFTTLTVGVTMVGVTLKPRDIDLGAADVAEYFTEAEPSPTVIEAWKRDGVWRETYIKNAKALVCIDDCAASRTAMTPMDAGLEFVALEPGAHPTRFRLLGKSKPLAGQLVMLVPASGAAQRLRTDADGVVVVPAGSRGTVMLSTVWIRAPQQPAGRFLSDFASVVFAAD